MGNFESCEFSQRDLTEYNSKTLQLIFSNRAEELYENLKTELMYSVKLVVDGDNIELEFVERPERRAAGDHTFSDKVFSKRTISLNIWNHNRVVFIHSLGVSITKYLGKFKIFWYDSYIDMAADIVGLSTSYALTYREEFDDKLFESDSGWRFENNRLRFLGCRYHFNIKRD